MPLDSLHALFVDGLRDLYSAEAQLLKALPRLAKAASSPDLKAALTEHVAVTQKQVERLDEIFAALGGKAKGKKCVAMEGLVAEARELLAEGGEPAVLDAALICAAQKVEHYEIAGYGCARTIARRLGLADAERLLQETLDEEAETDQKLTAIAEAMVNPDAAAEGDDDAGGEDEAPARPARKPAAGKAKGGAAAAKRKPARAR